MITRIALFAASLAAALVLAAGVVLVTAPPSSGQGDMVDAAAETVPAPVIQVDTVYVTPEPAVTPPPDPAAPVVPDQVAAQGGEPQDGDHEAGEHDGEDD